SFTAVWTGEVMVVWGGLGSNSKGRNVFRSGGRYDPSFDTWTPTSIGVPPQRGGAGAVWTGSVALFWGGYDDETVVATNSGGRYDPLTDSWTIMSSANAPVARWSPSAVWTGEEMLVWGGLNPTFVGSGGRYDLQTDTWNPINPIGAPSP